MKGITEISLLIILGMLVVSGILFVSTFLIQWVWNIFMPAVFKLPEISFIQAFGLSILLGMITSSFRLRKK